MKFLNVNRLELSNKRIKRNSHKIALGAAIAIFATFVPISTFSSVFSSYATHETAKAETSDVSVIDFAWLYPITNSLKDSNSNSLLTLDRFEGLAKLFPSILDMQYGSGTYEKAFKKEVKSQYRDLEVAPKSCLSQIKNWKLVAVRLDPFQTLAAGSPLFLDLRQRENYRKQHRRVPQIRLTFQPFCQIIGSEPRETTIADSALHILYNVFSNPQESEEHQTFYQQYLSKIPQWSDFSSLDESEASFELSSHRELAKAESKYLNWLSNPKRNRSIHSMISFIDSLRRERSDKKITDLNWRSQMTYAVSLKGHVRVDRNEAPTPDITHPFLDDSQRDKKSNGIGKYMEQYLISKSKLNSLFEVRNMSTGSGGQNWSFAAMKYDRKTKSLTPRKIKLFDSHSLAKLPATLLDLGYYDSVDLGISSEFKAASPIRKKILRRNNNTYEVQQPKIALQTIDHENRLADPLSHNGSQQSCFNCHMSHERFTMAKRTALGHPPQDFGYIIRGFGYFHHYPIISERFIREAKLTQDQINHWKMRWKDIKSSINN